jgi:hypothetical protein
MQKILSLLLIISFNLSALDLICMGNSNTNQLIQVEVDLDTRLGKVTIEEATHDLQISNDFMYVWQNKFDNQTYTNTLSRIDGSLSVIAEGAGPDGAPLIRAILACRDKKDLLF